MTTLTARFVLPVAAPPLPGGVVAVDGERLAFVGPAGSRAADCDLGNAAIIPGLVNAHTHLDLTGMRGLAPPSPDFTGWLRRVIAHRRQRTAEQVAGDVRAGLAEAVRTGTTLIGDISGDGGSWEALATSGIRSVVFREMLGLTSERADAALAAARLWLDGHADTPTCRAALSPHAPYSVRADLFGRAAVLAGRRRCPIATHLAESAAELELLHHHRGPFVAFLKELGVWDKEGLAASPGAVMKICDARVPKLFVHGNHLAPSARIPRNSSVVYCPRTYAAFGQRQHPFREFLARGVRVALGTDSLASNPSLDLLAEARFVHRIHSDFPQSQLLRMATLSGAEALGFEADTGSLEPGKGADLAVVPLPRRDGAAHELLFESDAPVSRVMCRGRWIVP